MTDVRSERQKERKNQLLKETEGGKEREGIKGWRKKGGYKNERGMRKTGERGHMFYRCHLKERAGVEADCNEL